MGKYVDFAIKFDPEKDTQEDLTKKILYSLIIKRIRHKKPVVIFIGGDSGEGKSYTALRLEELLLELEGYNLIDYLDDINVFTPLEYPKKLNRLLGLEECNKDLKKVRILCMHEARDIIKAKMWHTFLNQAIADVNAMSRTVKRLCFIVISQFIRDISTDIRYTLTYYCTVYRPLGGKAQLKIDVIYKDDRDLEKPRMNKRSIRGYLVYPNGKKRFFKPQYLELKKPSKEVIEIFEKRDFEAKAQRIRQKTEQLLQQMESEFNDQDKKLNAIIKWYMEDKNRVKYIGTFNKGKFNMKTEIKQQYGLTDTEYTRLKELFNSKFKEDGLI